MIFFPQELYAINFSFPFPFALFLQASICRCSQPLSGFSARCLEDEQMLEAIRKTNPNTDYMYVVDTRPRVSCFEIISITTEITPFPNVFNNLQ